MTDHISFKQQVVARVHVHSVYGRAGLGFCQLAVRLAVSLYAREESDRLIISNLAGELEALQRNQIGPLIGRMLVRGDEVTLETRPYHQDCMPALEMELSRERVEAIEALRVGQGLGLRLVVTGQVMKPATGETERLRLELSHTATQSDWVRVLDQMGYRKTLLLEIPMPSADAPDDLKQAVEHLRQAQDLMMHGKYRDAVGRCRDVLESLETALGDATAVVPSSQRDWDKACRIRNVRSALKVLTHPARHADQVSTQHEWGPEDAASILTATAALFRLATQD